MHALRFATMTVAFTALAVAASAQSFETFVGGHGATTPATYTGSGPEADWHLDLWPNQGFHLRRTAKDGTGEDFAGLWFADGETGAIVLPLGGEDVPLVVRNAERLRPPAAPGDGSGDLVTDGALRPGPVSLPLSGMFSYFADAPTLVHCATGHLHPVAQEGDYPALEAAYLEDRPGPAEPLFVTLDGTIEMREQMEGPERLTVTVEEFGSSWMGETCVRAAANPALEGTVWRIQSLDGEPLTWTPPDREPYLVLRGAENRFNASVGCNTMMGGFTADAARLSFTKPASTRMACPEGLASWEADLASALDATASHEIGGRTLRLLDTDGGILAEFEAAYVP